jgi:hypothetical protein
MPGPATTFTWNWGAPNQDRNDRYNQQGELTELKNCRYTEGGAVEKRLGMVRTAITTFNGATYAGPATALECSDKVIVRDSSDQLWVRDDGTGEGYYRGRHQRATYTAFEVENRANLTGARKPCAALSGGDLFTFALGAYTSGVEGYQLTVSDPITGTTKRETEIVAVSAASIVACAAATDDLGNVWFVFTQGGTTIVLHKYTSPTAAPVITTYGTVAGAAFKALDIRAVPSDSKMVIAALSFAEDGSDGFYGVYRSYANTSGGVATASDFDVATVTGAWDRSNYGGMTILEGQMASSTYHIAYVIGGAGATDAVVKLEDVSITSPSTSTVTTLATPTLLRSRCQVGISGWRAANGDRVVNATIADATSDNQIYRKNSLIVTRYTYNGSTVAPLVTARSAYVASKPFEVGGAFYWLSGFDDDDYRGLLSAVPNEQFGVQNGYFVRNADGHIVTSVLDGEAGFAFFDTLDDGGVQGCDPNKSHAVAPAVLSDGRVAVPLLSAGLVRIRPARAVAVIDFAAANYSTAPDIVPGGIPCRVTERDQLAELSPIHGPYARFEWTVSAGSFASAHFVTFLYRITDSDGQVYRSFPYKKALTAETFTSYNAVTFTLPTVRHVIGARIDIEVYGSPDGLLDMYLQGAVPNDPSVDSVQFIAQPIGWSTNGEILYSTNGLGNISPVPARLAWTQGTRTMLGGTASGEVWPSRDWQQGRGPEFHSSFNFDTNKFGVGELKAAIEIDATSSALFKSSGIAIATGGPDGRGSGGWVVQDLHVKVGCSNPAAVARGPLGIYFPDDETGRMQLLAGGVVRQPDIAAGMVAYKDFVWTSAVHCPDEQLIRWTATNGKRLELHYGYPPSGADYGTWILADGDGLVAAVGGALIGGAHVALAAGGSTVAVLYSPSAGVTDADFLDDLDEVLIEHVSSRMSPAGFMGEFDTDTTTLSSTWLGGSSTYEYSMIPARGATEVHPDIASEDADVAFRTALFRQREFALRVRETSATGRGRRFDGVAVAIRAYGRIKSPYRQIA